MSSPTVYTAPFATLYSNGHEFRQFEVLQSSTFGLNFPYPSLRIGLVTLQGKIVCLRLPGVNEQGGNSYTYTGFSDVMSWYCRR